MLSIDECRKLLGREDLTDAEVAEFLQDLRNFLSQFLDEYFHRTLLPVLTPLAVDPGRPFPYLGNRSPCLVTRIRPAVASAFIHGPELIALLLFTPLFACWSIWLGSAISSRSTDYRVAQQFSTFASLPPIAAAALVAFGVIKPSLGLALGFAAALLLIEGVGWRITASYFDRERLVTGSRALPSAD